MKRGSQAQFRLRLERNVILPFDIELPLAACKPALSKRIPCERSPVATAIPPSVIIRRGQPGAAVPVSFGAGQGRVSLVSVLPKALGGSGDDADVAVY